MTDIKIDYNIYIVLISLLGIILIPLIIHYTNYLSEATKIIQKEELTEKGIKDFIVHYKDKTNTLNNYKIYIKFLSKTLKEIDNFFGKFKLVSLKTYERVLMISIIYASLYFIIASIFGTNMEIKYFSFLQNIEKHILFIYLISLIIFILFLFNISKIYTNNMNSLSILILLVLSLPVMISFEYLEQLGVLALSIIVGIFVIIRNNTYSGIFFFNLMIIFIGFILLQEKGLSDFKTQLLIFFIVLPLINSIFDYFSFQLSRYFAIEILKAKKLSTIIIDILLDLIFAIFFMIIIIFVLLNSIESLYSYLNINIENSIISSYIENPFSKSNLWYNLMFATTLIPTIMHILLGIFTIIMYNLEKIHLKKLITSLETLELSNNIVLKKRVAKIIAKEDNFTYLLFLKILIFLTILLSGYWLIWEIYPTINIPGTVY